MKESAGLELPPSNKKSFFFSMSMTQMIKALTLDSPLPILHAKAVEIFNPYSEIPDILWASYSIHPTTSNAQHCFWLLLMSYLSLPTSIGALLAS